MKYKKAIHVFFSSLLILGSLQVNLKPILAENAWQMFARTTAERYEREQQEKRNQETIGWIISFLIVGGSGYFCYWIHRNSNKPK